jgi:S-DNA-T family DNA segregation ATPase FtsK/SpoIIIE
VSDDEVSAVVEFWKKQMKPNYQVDFSEFGNEEEETVDDFGASSGRSSDIVDDPIYSEAVQFVLESGKVSISQLQRRFRIGFNRAARYVEQMEKDGILGQADGTRPRMVNR